MKNPFDTEERRAFRDTVRNFIAKEIAPYADEWDEAGEIPWELHEKVAALGVFGHGVPEELGGLGFTDHFMGAIYAEEMGFCGAQGITSALGGRSISIGPLANLAPEEIRNRVVPEIISGRKSSSLGITEPSGGSDVASLKTTAKLDGNHYVINGSKTFITAGMKSDYFVIGARTGGPGLTGISLFFVEADTPGFTRTAIDRKMGWWCSDTATLYFDNVRVPATNMIGPKDMGFLAIVNNFNGERLGMIWQSIGMMKLCMRESIEWAKERETFGKPLISRQVIRHKIVDMSTKIDATEAYATLITKAIEDGEQPVAELAKCKAFATKNLEWVASEAMQIFGGAAYLRGNLVERVYREVKVMSIGGGSEEIMRELAFSQMKI